MDFQSVKMYAALTCSHNTQLLKLVRTDNTQFKLGEFCKLVYQTEPVNISISDVDASHQRFKNRPLWNNRNDRLDHKRFH